MTAESKKSEKSPSGEKPVTRATYFQTGMMLKHNHSQATKTKKETNDGEKKYDQDYFAITIRSRTDWASKKKQFTKYRKVFEIEIEKHII